MPPPDTTLAALPSDPTPDAGPMHRGGPLTLFVAVSCALAAIGSALILFREDRPAWGGACLVLLGALAVWAGRRLCERFRHGAALPRSHAILTGALGFEIHGVCRDVAATVFFDPDHLTPGAPTRLLCFVENYASRQRVARFEIGPHRALGLDRPRLVALHLAAGQAAVYALPLAVDPALALGEHDLPVSLRVHRPNGTGARLPGVRRHLYNVWTVRFAAPFTLAPATRAAAAAAASPPAAATYLSLASVSEGQPRLGALQKLVADAPTAGK